jgi:hypothetical protein
VKKMGKEPCIKITMNDLFDEIKGIKNTLEQFNKNNQDAHQAILDKLELEVTKANAELAMAKAEHEKIKGSINLSNLTIWGVLSFLVALTYIVLGHLGIKF